MTIIKKYNLKATLLRVASIALLGCMCSGSIATLVCAVIPGAPKKQVKSSSRLDLARFYGVRKKLEGLFNTPPDAPTKKRSKYSRLPITNQSSLSKLSQTVAHDTPLRKEKPIRLPNFIIEDNDDELPSVFCKNPSSFSVAYGGLFSRLPVELKYEAQAVNPANNDLPKPDPAVLEALKREIEEHPEDFWYLDEPRPFCIRNLLPEMEEEFSTEQLTILLSKLKFD